MISHQLDQSLDDVNSIDPQLLKKYLELHGWQLENKLNEKAEIFSIEKKDRKFSVLLPLIKDIPDFEDRMLEVLKTLEFFEERSASRILSNVISSSELAQKKKREIFSLKFKFLNEIQKKEASAKKFGSLLSALQELFDAVGQSEAGIQSQSNRVPKNVADRTELSIFETFQGSFGVKLALSPHPLQLNLLEEPLGEKVSETFLELVKCSDNPDKQMLKEHLTRLKRKSAVKYRKFLSSIISSEADIFLDWGSVNPEKGGQAELSFSNAIQTIDFINKLEEEEPEEYNVLGELIAANKTRKTIEIEEIATKKTISGKMVDIILDNELIELTIGKTYYVTIQEKSYINPATGEERVERTIIDISSCLPLEQP